MATVYYLTTTASDLSVPGDNWDNTLEESAPGTTTLDQSVPKAATENDYGFTQANNPSDEGTSGDFVVTAEINAGDAALTLEVQLARVNSGGTVQSGPVGSDGGSQTATAGTLTFNFTAPSLGTWATGDRLRVTFIATNTATMGGAKTITHDIGSAGTRVSAPWDLGGDVVDNAAFFGCNF